MVDWPCRLSSFTLRTARLGKVTGVSSTPCSRPRRAVALPDEEGDEREPKEGCEARSARGASTRSLALLASSLLVRSLLSCSEFDMTSNRKVRVVRDVQRGEETVREEASLPDEEKARPLLRVARFLQPLHVSFAL